jgi:hypothetical protein
LAASRIHWSMEVMLDMALPSGRRIRGSPNSSTQRIKMRWSETRRYFMMASVPTKMLSSGRTAMAGVRPISARTRAQSSGWATLAIGGLRGSGLLGRVPRLDKLNALGELFPYTKYMG